MPDDRTPARPAIKASPLSQCNRRIGAHNAKCDAIEYGGSPVTHSIMHGPPKGFNATPWPDLTDTAPFQRPPMLKEQYLGSDLDISVVVEQGHIMGVGKGGDQEVGHV